MPNAYEWTVIRAVPRVERAEFVNVGVIVYCQALDYLEARTTSDLSRVLDDAKAGREPHRAAGRVESRGVHGDAGRHALPVLDTVDHAKKEQPN